jgi:CheY-like chemotaxis protein
MQTHSAASPKTFLIVDDEPLARLELAEIVKECGFGAWEAASTEEALALLEERSDGVVGLITDIAMPGTRNGTVLANHVRWLWPHINIIVVSAARCPLEGELPGQVPFIAKPVPPSRLMDAITSSAHQQAQVVGSGLGLQK